MSVYEPFGNNREFYEDSPLKPPKSDAYAFNKYKFETSLRSFSGITKRLLILRPTVVYGPFCRPWTDNLLSAFLSGDVSFSDLGGRIQPIYVGDVSLFLFQRVSDFRPGIFNLAGPEVLTWHDIFSFFAEIAGRGTLIRCEQQSKPVPRQSYIRNVKEFFKVLDKEQTFINLAKPILDFFPYFLKRALRSLLIPSDYSTIRYHDTASTGGPYCRPFFAQDRLVSMDLFKRTYPDFDFTKLSSTRKIFFDYFCYRFTDKQYR
jgi:nucleoside-diphosphate-sugar epimerase